MWLQSYLNSNNFVVESIDKPMFNFTPFDSDNGDNWLLTLILKESEFNFYCNTFVVESIDKPLPVFNPTQLNVEHNSLLALTSNVSLYLALNFLVEKSINNGPASPTPSLASNLGF